MRMPDRSDKLRELGLTPTIQRLAVLESLEKTNKHPTADQILHVVRKKFPTLSRATVYNTLEALTKAGAILRITVDPSVARYDADIGPHAHFRCRVCSTVYDIDVEDENTLGDCVDGHQIEAVRTYAYGICSSCLAKDASTTTASPNGSQSSHPSSRKAKAFLDEPTTPRKEKSSQRTSQSDSQSSNPSSRKTKAFLDEPTKEVRNA